MKQRTKFVIVSVSSFILGFSACLGLLIASRFGGTTIVQTQREIRFVANDPHGEIFLPAGTKLIQGDKIPYAPDEHSVFYLPVSTLDFSAFKHISNFSDPTCYGEFSHQPK